MFNLHSSCEFYSIEDSSIIAGHSTKLAGDARDSAVVRSVLKKAGAVYQGIVIPKQVHSTTVSVIREPVIGISRPQDCDGIVTSLPGIALTALTADCVSVIFSDPEAGVIGVAHMGWKGTLGNMAQNMINHMCSEGAATEHIQAYIASSIGVCCYNVPEDRVQMFRKAFPSLPALYIESRDDNFFLNLPLLNRMQFEEAGVPGHQIHMLDKCTSCNPELFYSYRRDTKEAFGEMVSFIIKK